MRTRRALAAAGAAATVTAAAFCPAASAAPAALGPGHLPHLAVSPSGTAHVVWKDGSVKYCRLRTTGNGCAAGTRRELVDPAAGEAFAFFDNRAAYVFAPSDDDIVVVESRGGAAEVFAGEDPPPTRLLVHRSTDGGATFAAPVQIGDVELDFSEGVALADSKVFATSTMAGGETTAGQPLFAQAAPSTGPAATGKALLFSDSSRLGDYSTVTVADGRAAVVWNHGANLFLRRQISAGDPNDVGTWSARSRIGRREIGSFCLESGRRGTFLVYVPPGGTAKVRRLGAGGFGGATAVRGAQGASDVDLFESGSGRLFTAWTHNRRSSGDYALSFTSRGRGGWATPVTLAHSDTIQHPEIATNANGSKRFAVWTTSAGGTRTIRARKF